MAQALRRTDTAPDTPPCLGAAAERRRHLRALEHWRACRPGRGFPTVGALDLDGLAATGAETVLIALSPDRPPLLRRLGDAPALTDPLLARLALPIDAMRAARDAVPFESDFIDAQGLRVRARGVLLPLSSNGAAIDRALAVYSAKQELDAGGAAAIEAELAAAAGAAGPCRRFVADA